jgi:hypothetical protein
MDTESSQSLVVVFQPPEPDPRNRHERTLSGLPRSIAMDIKEDFARICTADTGRSPYQLYRYTENGQERLIALDFTEIVDVYEKENESLSG